MSTKTQREFKVGDTAEIRDVPQGYMVEETVATFQVEGEFDRSLGSVPVRDVQTKTPYLLDYQTQVRVVALPDQPKPADMLLLKAMVLASGLGSTLRGYESCIYWMKESYDHPDRHADHLSQIARHASEASAYHSKARGQYEGLLTLVELLGSTPIPEDVQAALDLAKSHNVKI